MQNVKARTRRTWSMSLEKDEDIAKAKVTRRGFLKGVGAGAAVAAVAVAGVEELRIMQMGQQPVTPGPGPQPTAPEVTTVSTVSFTVNGTDYTVEVDNRWSLAEVLHEKLGLYGTKIGCDRGECGACAVLLDGVPVQSCMVLAADTNGAKITTIEGIGTPQNLSKLQKSLLDNDGTQCGVCIPGIVVVATDLLSKNPNPTEDEVRAALDGNFCRCGNQPNIIKSVLAVK
jgi:aerobic-type carbon monoxide dehydrogenase small subunit (CoxS/CutS family)